ncbi:putative glutathione S-transferase [Cinnamomum micranthum f. kanehirae]|uniref:Glutathione S-transferase n=1 Tax=Cinnamomum micranthum f. kanehirae TaxID=337451 RepID=A0A3S3N8X8_9MAGN|nr:putative glutathione S-transferase [Cinnamomum micranthum f. kanehirae]
MRTRMFPIMEDGGWKGLAMKLSSGGERCGVWGLLYKSELLLRSIPIYKKVPILIHGEKPIRESVIILNYIEEAWPFPFLATHLPISAFTGQEARYGRVKGKHKRLLLKEYLLEILKVLEGTLGEKDYGGHSFGFTDIVAIPYTTWFYGYEQYGGFKDQMGELVGAELGGGRGWQNLQQCPAPPRTNAYILVPPLVTGLCLFHELVNGVECLVLPF